MLDSSIEKQYEMFRFFGTELKKDRVRKKFECVY